MSAEPLVILHHIPKTAGSTLVKAFRSVYDRKEIYSANGWFKSSDYIKKDVCGLPDKARRSIRLVFGHQVWYGIHALFEQPAIYISFLRNPMARFVSFFYYVRRTRHHELWEAYQKHDLAEVVRDPTLVLANHMTVYFSRSTVDGHNTGDCLQVDSAMLAKAINNLHQYAFVGIQESMDAELNRLNNTLPRKITLETFQRVAPPEDVERFSDIDPSTMEQHARINWADHALYGWAILNMRMNLAPHRQPCDKSAA